MTRARLLIACLLLACLSGGLGSLPAHSSAEPAPTKQLAGPPEDILAGAMQLPEPDRAGIRSHYAMIPVSFTQTQDGAWEWQGQIAVDASEGLALMAFAPDGTPWELHARTEGGQQLTIHAASKDAGLEAAPSALGIGENQVPGQLFTFAQAETGRWTLTAKADSKADGYLLLSSKSTAQYIFSHLQHYNLWQGHEIGLVTYAYTGKVGDGEKPAPSMGLIHTAEMEVLLPSQATLRVAMADDGRHGDGAAGDGVFGGFFKATEAGDYVAQVRVQGVTAEGQPFLRSSEHAFPVIAPNLTLTSDPVAVEVLDENRLAFQLGARFEGAVPAQVQLFAEVWGQGQDGAMIPVAWVGGMVQPVTGKRGTQLPLSLDARWIARAAAQAPFELRHVRVQDVDTHIVLAGLAQVPLTVRALPAAAFGKAEAISDEMLMGPRPATLPTTAAQAYVGGRKLMLVHGYCSGIVWQASHFTSGVVFEDYTQNRSHDAFARLIRDFGSQFDSFGVVAHSQGGAAALHLKTFYWSGLDSASGSRLIQSVGTPYQGTSLAGNLALLGQIFNVGCGTNWDLTYDGAALWLSSIPTWARSKVYYHTTSFTDGWGYDYCQAASDLVLRDPDDGTTEKWSGQLSGANNLGHKTGQCHTIMMRDPAQYYDSSRNANMNANASR